MSAKQMSAKQKMHWLIMGWVGVFVAFAVTLPIAIHRVSRTEKFTRQPLKSLTCAGKSTPKRVVTVFSTCAVMRVEAPQK